jgi:nucleotide-binding universal stress UspA family protein
LYRKILVPLDGSSLSESILGQAADLVKECNGSELVLLTVVEPFREQPFRKEDDWNTKIQKEGVRVAGNYLKALKEKLMSEGVKVNVEVIVGDPAQEILAYSIKNEIDLIMMNAKGRSANKRWFFGSVAKKIIDHSPIPVLINPTPRMP